MKRLFKAAGCLWGHTALHGIIKLSYYSQCVSGMRGLVTMALNQPMAPLSQTKYAKEDLWT